ncbi:hypothetical protein HTZ85_23765 [Escherichia coli]|nr:hypothetical protein [Escherichia coli]
MKRIQTEAAAGRKTGGSVDLLWVNGENFRTLKRGQFITNGLGGDSAQLALCRHTAAGAGRFFSADTRCGNRHRGGALADVYRPPRYYATTTTNAASLTGVC